MWSFNSIDELRYDHLIGLTREDQSVSPRISGPRERCYLLAAAARYCRWRDGWDSRKRTLSPSEAEHIEKRLIGDLIPLPATAGFQDGASTSPRKNG